jgi:hypothetical protein
MQIIIYAEILAAIGAATVFLYAPVRTLRYIARHCLLQARGLEARERAIAAERDEVWEVV